MALLYIIVLWSNTKMRQERANYITAGNASTLFMVLRLLDEASSIFILASSQSVALHVHPSVVALLSFAAVHVGVGSEHRSAAQYVRCSPAFGRCPPFALRGKQNKAKLPLLSVGGFVHIPFCTYNSGFRSVSRYFFCHY